MRIAITGGSGSLGTALVRRLTREGADRIVVFSRDEQRRARMQAEFSWHPGVRVYAGDVRDEPRLEDLFYGCDAVIHAAARKVVAAHPDEPREMYLTNIGGTLNVIQAASRAGVRKLLLVSSDKAVRAENCYGVSKAMAEHLVIAANAQTFPRNLKCSVIRYGNVLASNGSVLVLWRQLAAAGQPLPLSDPQMTRFWLVLPRAVDFVLRALGDMRGGEVFVPRLPAAPLTTLAQALVECPQFQAIGIRPGGEKVHEEMLSAAEIVRARVRNGFYVVPPFQHLHMWDNTPWLGEPVPEGFTYRSDTWEWQLAVEGMRDLLDDAEEAK